MTNSITLSDIPRPAWIVLMILGFILFWPIGLAILAYLMWSGQMICSRSGSGKSWRSWKARAGAMSSTGNQAFDDYRDETLKRLEQEARDFREFVERLRFAKDKEEFDRFMSDRSRHATEATPAN